MDKYTDLEIEQLRQFWANSEMRDVIFKVLTQDFAVLRDTKLTNEEIGERNRAIWAAQDIVNSAYKEIEGLNQKVEPMQTKLNRAR